ncbi:hypothetical protein Plhal304r1_c057g0143791 [Plasmopara halstedii]
MKRFAISRAWYRTTVPFRSRFLENTHCDWIVRLFSPWLLPPCSVMNLTTNLSFELFEPLCCIVDSHHFSICGRQVRIILTSQHVRKNSIRNKFVVVDLSSFQCRWAITSFCQIFII